MDDDSRTKEQDKPQADDIMPYDSDAYYVDPDEEQYPPEFRAPTGQFAYDGRGMTSSEFTAHVQSYNFGSVPPDFVVLHHTAIPSTKYTWADVGQGSQWDAGEDGMSEAQIKVKRKRSLDGIRDTYAGRGWNAGPHLFVDDRFIWLFTPMYNPGIHAKWGNSFRDKAGKLHYSIGIEVVGYYEKRQWPPEVQSMVRHAVTTLQKRLGTFTLEYLYPNGSPGMVGTGDNQRCAHPERLRWGGISSHRDYNKPQCPGAAITESFYMKVIRGDI